MSAPPARSSRRTLPSWGACAAALALGALHAASFAPWPAWWLQIATLTGLLGLWRRHGGNRAGRAAWLGGLFGFSWYACGMYWLFISMHHYGGMPAVLAALAVALLAAYMAIYPALALALTTRLLRPAGSLATIARSSTPELRGAPLFAAAWCVCEWLRGWVFTGLPWVSSGYAHADGPLAGWAAVIGVYGVGAMAALASFALATLIAAQAAVSARDQPDALRIVGDDASAPGAGSASGARLATSATAPSKSVLPAASRARSSAYAMACLALAMAGGIGLQAIEWSHPQGAPIEVRLTQGNVEQSTKFDPLRTVASMHTYADLLERKPGDAPIDLAVLPETAWTVPWSSTPPEVAARLLGPDAPATIAVGAPMPPLPESLAYDGSSDPSRYAISNSVVVVTRGHPQGPVGQYDKHHLVPFGEFIPTGFNWFVALMQIPLGTFTRGPLAQAPIEIAGQSVGFDICYEDLFGEALLPSVRAGATLLINVTNIGWFGDSLALPQHLQIARMRALESARPMLRATNTGMTAAIDARGRVLDQLPPFTIGALNVRVQGMSGLTPYARFGNPGPLAIAALILVLASLRRRPRQSS